jgi:hypothetical protein
MVEPIVESTFGPPVGHENLSPKTTTEAHVHDGMLERDAARMNIAAILTASMNMHAREALQHLTQAVLQASGGQLCDDATALCLDWHGGPPRDRDATSGADREGRLHQAASA